MDLLDVQILCLQVSVCTVATYVSYNLYLPITVATEKEHCVTFIVTCYILNFCKHH